jgi:hypothetical protein
MMIVWLGSLLFLPYLAAGDRSRQTGSVMSSYYVTAGDPRADVLGWSLKKFAKKAVKVVKKAADPRTSLRVIKKAANPMTALNVAKQIVKNPLAVKKNLASLAKLDPGIRLATSIARAAKSPSPAKRAAAVRTIAKVQTAARQGSPAAQRIVTTTSNLTAAVTAAQAAKDAQAARDAEARRLVEETPYAEPEAPATYDELPAEEEAPAEPEPAEEYPTEELTEEPPSDEATSDDVMGLLDIEADVLGANELPDANGDERYEILGEGDEQIDILGAAKPWSRVNRRKSNLRWGGVHGDDDVLGEDVLQMLGDDTADVMGWGINFRKISVKQIPWNKVAQVATVVGTAVAVVYPPAAPFVAAGLLVVKAAQNKDPKALLKIAEIKTGAASGNPTAQAALAALETAQNVANAANEAKKTVTAAAAGDATALAKIDTLKQTAAAGNPTAQAALSSLQTAQTVVNAANGAATLSVTSTPEQVTAKLEALKAATRAPEPPPAPTFTSYYG